MMTPARVGNQWTLRAAHRIDCSERCIDCLLFFLDIQEQGIDACDDEAKRLGLEMQAERERLAAEKERAA